MHAVREVLDELQAYVTRNASRYPITEPFPSRALEALERRRTRLPAEAAPILIAVLDLADRFEQDPYEGEEYGRQAAVVNALAWCTWSEAIETRLAQLLKGVTFTDHARPFSPDPSKYDRDSAVEWSQDGLALACAKALSRLGVRLPGTRDVMTDAARHRDPQVARAVRS